MAETFLSHDRVAESTLPEHATDSRSGDRVAFLEAGLLYVEGGKATFARWSEVHGVLEDGEHAYVLVSRRPPHPPWLKVGANVLNDEPRAVQSFVGRIRERSASGGYRDAVRRGREGMSKTELMDRVRSRVPVAGALEVPSTIYLGSKGHPLEGLALFSLVAGGGGISYVFTIMAMVMLEHGRHGPADLLGIIVPFAPYIGLALGGWAAVTVRKRWRRAREAELPRQRVLVLAPDGAIIGFRTGVQTLAWNEVGSFETGPTEPDYNDGLIVRDLDGKKLGDIDAGWLDAPLGLVVKVAETYREAAAS